MANVKVYNIEGKEVGTMELSDAVFGVEVNEHLVHMAVVAQLANKRQGTQKAKTRSEVSGGGRKPWRQKGTGHARQGSTRAPQWTGGGVVFAPKPRDFSQKINKKMRDIAFSSAISQKIAQNEVYVIDDIKFADSKTKAASEFLKTFGLNKRTIILTDGKDESVVKATNNIQKVSCVDASLLNVAQVVENTYVVFTKNAIKKLEEAYV